MNLEETRGALRKIRPKGGIPERGRSTSLAQNTAHSRTISVSFLLLADIRSGLAPILVLLFLFGKSGPHCG
jgi:hypothetical protein